MRKKQKKEIFLSIVIPAYNEEENFKRGVLEEVATSLAPKKFSWEVILVDDGSTDQTPKLLTSFVKTHKGFRIFRIPHAGKGEAVAAGVSRASGEIVLFTDFDQSTPISEVDKFLREFRGGADVVIADRFASGAKRVDDSFLSLARSRLFNWFVQTFLIKGIRDTQCGFKAFKNEIAQKLFKNLKVYKNVEAKNPFMGAFDVELLFLAQKEGLKIVSLPVLWQRVKSNKLTILEPLRMLFDVLKIRFFDLLGRYGNKKKAPGGLIDKFLPALVILVLVIPAVWNIAKPGYFRMHDDLQAMRQLQMDKCFRDLQIPCRWVPDLGYGYGYPLFNYYPPMPYYLGEIVHLLGFSFLDTVKVLFILAFFVSAATMYLLAGEFWGRLGGIVSAVFYVYAPYHAVDVYVRGAMNEAWALAWFPGILWGIYKVTWENKWKYVLALALFIGMLALTHSPMLMVFVPGATIWAVFWLWRTKKLQGFTKLLVAGLWGAGLASFFTLPVIFESKFAHVETLVIGYFNYLAHFVSLAQFFVWRDWGYGESVFGTGDTMSFQIGHLHWIASFISLLIAWRIRKIRPTISLTIIFFFFLTYAYTFMAHARSTPIWQVIKPLEFLQFPWRFLALTILGVSFLAGSLLLLLNSSKNLLKIGFALLLIIGVILWNKDYFTWRDWWPWVDDQHKFSGELWRLQITSGIFDYLPIWAPLPPATGAAGDAQFIEGNGTFSLIRKTSNFQEFEILAQTPVTFQINTFYFPGWQVFVNGSKVIVDPRKDPELGRMRIALGGGEHRIVAKFTNTPIRTIGNILSLFSWVILLVFLWQARLKRFL